MPLRYEATTSGQEAVHLLSDVTHALPEAELSKRIDLRETMSFTVEDGDGCRQMALSFDKLDEGRYVLIVHSADVTHFVKRGSLIDTEAQKRGKYIK